MSPNQLARMAPDIIQEGFSTDKTYQPKSASTIKPLVKFLKGLFCFLLAKRCIKLKTIKIPKNTNFIQITFTIMIGNFLKKRKKKEDIASFFYSTV